MDGAEFLTILTLLVGPLGVIGYRFWLELQTPAYRMEWRKTVKVKNRLRKAFELSSKIHRKTKKLRDKLEEHPEQLEAIRGRASSVIQEIDRDIERNQAEELRRLTAQVAQLEAKKQGLQSQIEQRNKRAQMRAEIDAELDRSF